MENVFLNSPLHRLLIVPWTSTLEWGYTCHAPWWQTHRFIQSGTTNATYQETFTGENFCKMVENKILWRKLSQIALCWYQKMPSFAYKTFTNSHKNSNSQKFSAIWHALWPHAQPMCTSRPVSNVVMMTTYTWNTSSLLVLDFPAFLEWVCHKCLTIVLKLEGYSPPPLPSFYGYAINAALWFHWLFHVSGAGPRIRI